MFTNLRMALIVVRSSASTRLVTSRRRLLQELHGRRAFKDMLARFSLDSMFLMKTTGRAASSLMRDGTWVATVYGWPI